jgi:hypothetical protein
MARAAVLAVLAFVGVGCATAPSGYNRIDATSGDTIGTFYTKDARVDHVQNRLRFTDDLTGNRIMLLPKPLAQYTFTPMSKADYERAVWAARSERARALQIAREAQARQQAVAREQSDLELRVEQKDWQWWYDHYLSQGHSADEARLRADRMVRRR